MLYFHGNAGNIGHRLHNAQALYQHCGVNIFLVEYRGYGRSEGSLVSVVYVYILCMHMTSKFLWIMDNLLSTHMNTWFYEYINTNIHV